MVDEYAARESVRCAAVSSDVSHQYIAEYAARESVRCVHDIMRACDNARESAAKVKFLKKGVFRGENALH